VSSLIVVFLRYPSGAASIRDPSGGNNYDDEFRSQYLQDYIEATLESSRYQLHPCTSVQQLDAT
jgi:hypothetical protein